MSNAASSASTLLGTSPIQSADSNGMRRRRSPGSPSPSPCTTPYLVISEAEDVAGISPESVEAASVSQTASSFQAGSVTLLGTVDVVPLSRSSSRDSAASTASRPKHQNKRLPSYHYQPRMSTLDRQRLQQHQDPFRGFFTLFWLTMAVYVLLTFLRNMELYGVLMTGVLWRSATIGIGGLLVSDMAMLFAMLPIWAYHRLIVSRGWIPWRALELTIQHAYQTAFLFIALAHCIEMRWNFVQTSFFTLHTMAMLMKIHSFADKNSRFHWLDLRSQSIRIELETVDICAENEALLREELAGIEEELRPDDAPQRYPANLKLSNFAHYVIMPTLIYEIEYPRTKEIRWGYVAEKAAAMVGTIGLLYLTFEHYVVPVISTAGNTSFFGMLPQLMLPFLVAYLLVFFVVFECILNVAAEITRFADRSFYDDWWNSENWDEFARKWNKPVHKFLLRHVYLPLNQDLKLSKAVSTFLTFLLSSLVHELAVAVVVGRVRWYFFMIQMFQLPLVMLNNWMGRAWKENFGNAVFWFGMMIGPAILTYIYTVEYFVGLSVVAAGATAEALAPAGV